MPQKGVKPKNFEENIRPKSWQPGQSGNPNGRPRNRVPQLLKECLGRKATKVEDLNNYEVNAIENLIMSLDIDALTAISKSKTAPVYLITLARAAMMDMKNGRTRTLDLLRDRQFGAVKKEVDVTTNGGSLGAPMAMTPEEAKQVLKKIEEEY